MPSRKRGQYCPGDTKKKTINFLRPLFFLFFFFSLTINSWPQTLFFFLTPNFWGGIFCFFLTSCRAQGQQTTKKGSGAFGATNRQKILRRLRRKIIKLLVFTSLADLSTSLENLKSKSRKKKLVTSAPQTLNFCGPYFLFFRINFCRKSFFFF